MKGKNRKERRKTGERQKGEWLAALSFQPTAISGWNSIELRATSYEQQANEQRNPGVGSWLVAGSQRLSANC